MLFNLLLQMMICIQPMTQDSGNSDYSCQSLPFEVSVTDALLVSWQHSVEKTQWQELYSIQTAGLYLQKVSIQGSGAGMEIPSEAILKEGHYVYHPQQFFKQITLTYSPFTTDYRICMDNKGVESCQSLWAWINTLPQSLNLNKEAFYSVQFKIFP